MWNSLGTSKTSLNVTMAALLSPILLGSESGCHGNVLYKLPLTMLPLYFALAK